MSFYFAWVSNGDTTFGPEHHVEDEQIFQFSIDHTEGDFASLSIDIINPKVGLLNEGRSQWAWLAWKKPDDTVVPLFHGRLVGIPTDINREIVSLEFIGRPDDYDDQKKVLAETLKVAPYWDPIWVDQSKLDDPDVVLEARPQLWHIGRTDKTVTVSDILSGEDGTIALGEGDIFADSLSISYGSVPITKVHMEATVRWDQAARGTVDLSSSIMAKFGSTSNISSYTGQGLEASWPRYGADIGGGWTVFDSRVKLLSGGAVSATYHTTRIDPTKATPDFTIETWWASSPEGYDYWYKLAYDSWLADQILNPVREARFYLWVFRPTFVVAYDAKRARVETLSFDVSADTQPLTSDEEPSVVNISLQSSLVGLPVDPNGALPIGEISKNNYFGLDRAKQSIQYLLTLVRSKILFSARAVEVSFDCSFVTAVDFSCRKDVILTSSDLPGGECQGKITQYKLALDGDKGELSASVTIGCCIGRGNILDEPNTGTPTYVTSGYVDDYQHYAGSDIDVVGGDLTYKDFDVNVDDDGIDFSRMTPDRVIGDIPATALFTMTGPGITGETVTAGSRTYTLKDALDDVDQVLIGPTEEQTIQNLSDAINGTEELEGISFGDGTPANDDVSAVPGGGILRVTARIAGVAGNSITVSDTSSVGSWDAATLRFGSHGLNVYYPASQQNAVLNATYGSVQEAIDALNLHITEIEVSLKPVQGGPFTTLYPLVVSDMMVPKTIDLEAA